MSNERSAKEQKLVPVIIAAFAVIVVGLATYMNYGAGFRSHAAPLQPFDRFIEQFAVAVLFIDEAGMAGRAGDDRGVRHAGGNDRQNVDPCADQNGEFSTSLQRSTAHRGTVIAKQYALEHNVTPVRTAG